MEDLTFERNEPLQSPTSSGKRSTVSDMGSEFMRTEGQPCIYVTKTGKSCDIQTTHVNSHCCSKHHKTYMSRLALEKRKADKANMMTNKEKYPLTPAEKLSNLSSNFKDFLTGGGSGAVQMPVRIEVDSDEERSEYSSEEEVEEARPVFREPAVKPQRAKKQEPFVKIKESYPEFKPKVKPKKEKVKLDPLYDEAGEVLSEFDAASDYESELDEDDIQAAIVHQKFVSRTIRQFYGKGILGKIESVYPERFGGISDAFMADKLTDSVWDQAIVDMADDMGVPLHKLKSYHMLILSQMMLFTTHKPVVAVVAAM